MEQGLVVSGTTRAGLVVYSDQVSEQESTFR